MKILPPGLQGLSTHTFGKLSITLFDSKLNSNLCLIGYSPCFFGQCADQNIDNSNTATQNKIAEFDIGSTAEYSIMTNVWMFYLYLSDMDYLRIQLVATDCTGIFVQTKLKLKDLTQVMTKDFSSQTILKQHEEKCNILDQRGNSYGSVTVKIQTSFDIQITKQVKDLIDFQSLVIFEGISPINSQSELPREPPQQSRVAVNNNNINCQQLTNCKSNQILSSPLQSQIKVNSNYDYQVYEEKQQTEDYRMIEDDIDKIIRDMQSKPYDCSRYQEQSKASNHQQYKNVYSMSGFDNTNAKLRTHSQQMTHHETSRNSHDLFNNHNNNFETETSIKHFNMSRPPSSLSPKPRVNIPSQQTVINKSPRIVKQKQSMSSSSSNLLRTQSLPASNVRQQSNPSSYIDIKIHQMLVSISNAMPHTLFSQLMQPCYTLKVYLNSDQDQYFAGQGVKEGQIISFNHNLKIRNVNTIQSIRLVIADDYGRIQCEGVFDLTRLYASKDHKGVFTVPLITPTNTNQAMSRVKVNENKIVQVSLLHRSLRISAQLVSRVELVQVFMKISKPSFPFTMIRYKIPMTKETIEHMSAGSAHLNIFPHSCSSHVPEKIMLQFWKNELNIGQSEISLRNIKNINASALSTNIEPVYLYDGRKQVRNILEGDKVVGEIELTLCFGTVKQMQLLLLAAIDQQKQVTKQATPKIPVTLDERLGVLVTKKPVQQNQISIQVELDNQRIQEDHQQVAKFHEQPSFGDHSIISHTSHNEFMDLEPSLVSFAKHEVVLQKPATTISKVTPTPTINSYASVSQKISEIVCELLAPIVPHLAKIKEQCRPHLVYNFIGVDKLTNILQSLGIKARTINLLFKLVLFPKSDMTNVNILYDLLISADIEGEIKSNLISDEIIVVSGLRLLYQKQSARQDKNILITKQMDFKQMAQLFKRVQLKLTLHQFQILQKFISRYKTVQQAEQLKQAIIKQLQSETMAQLKEGFYEKDILQQIYNDDSSHTSQSRYSEPQSFDHKIHNTYPQCVKVQQKGTLKPIIEYQADLYDLVNTISSMKANDRQTKASYKSEQVEQKATQSPVMLKQSKKQLFKHCLTINGVDNVRQSAQCIFDPLPNNLEFNIMIQHPVKLEVSFTGSESKQFESDVDMKDADGKVLVFADKKIIASAGFSLIKGINSVYALKAEGGQFCGLLHILLH